MFLFLDLFLMIGTVTFIHYTHELHFNFERLHLNRSAKNENISKGKVTLQKYRISVKLIDSNICTTSFGNFQFDVSLNLK